METFKDALKITGLLAVLALTACAGKESEFAARYAKNGAGASIVNGTAATEAGDYASQKGLQTVDIVNLTRTRSGSTSQITSYILLNNQQIQVTTTHTGTEIREGAVQAGNFQVQFHAMCINSGCEPYFAAMEVYSLQTRELLIQEGIRIHFNDMNRSVYQMFKPAQARVFYNQSVYDTSGVVGYLNSYQGSTSSGAGGTSSVIGL